MNAFFDELFAYNYHSNQQLATYITEHADRVSYKTLQLFSHILNAHHIWNSRILGEKNAFGVWQIHPHDDFSEIDKTNYRNTRSILATHGGLDAIIQYKTTTGNAFQNTIKDVLFHAINHSTYHRGQIATELRQSGLEPLPTDYIFYKR